MVLEILGNGISDSGILRCVANEDGGRTTARPLVAAAFGHFWCPRRLRGIVAHAFRVGNPGTFGVAERPLQGGQFAWPEDRVCRSGLLAFPIAAVGAAQGGPRTATLPETGSSGHSRSARTR